MARTSTPTAEIAPAMAYESRRLETMTMTATPNIAPPTREMSAPRMNRGAPGTANRGR